MLTIHVLDDFIADRFGELAIRDPNQPIGWRAWAEADTAAVFEWLEGRAADGFSDLTCYTIKRLTELLGVSEPTVQAWLKRSEHPMPHVRKGHAIRIPAFLLKEWLREESTRHNHRA